MMNLDIERQVSGEDARRIYHMKEEEGELVC